MWALLPGIQCSQCELTIEETFGHGNTRRLGPDTNGLVKKEISIRGIGWILLRVLSCWRRNSTGVCSGANPVQPFHQATNGDGKQPRIC